MSTCPEKDLHSVYLDGELPAKYVAEYEAHVASCPKCKMILDTLKEVQGVFAKDRDSYKFSQSQLDSSFERLQAKMSYSKTLKFNEKNVRKFPAFTNSIKYIATGVAAALVVAIVLPVKTKTVASSEQTQFVPVAHREVGSSVDQVMASGTLSVENINSFLGEETPSYHASTVSNVTAGTSMQKGRGRKGRSGQYMKPELTSYDVFYSAESDLTNVGNFQMDSVMTGDNSAFKIGN